MKSSLVIPVASFVVLTALVAYRVATPSAPSDEPAAPAGAIPPPPGRSTGDIRIFEQAFWKRPTANDRILHAERREWSDSSGVTKWQWFIAVEPSPELVKYLREDNAFNLVPASTPPRVEGAPEWFAFDPGDMTAVHAPGGGMTLVFSKNNDRLYATDSGRGFNAGAPEPAKSTIRTPIAGRLPPTPPPNPLKP